MIQQFSKYFNIIIQNKNSIIRIHGGKSKSFINDIDHTSGIGTFCSYIKSGCDKNQYQNRYASFVYIKEILTIFQLILYYDIQQRINKRVDKIQNRFEVQQLKLSGFIN